MESAGKMLNLKPYTWSDKKSE